MKNGNSKTRTAAGAAAMALLLLASGPAFSADAGTMFGRFADFAPALERLTVSAAYVLGIASTLFGVMAIPRVEKGQSTWKNVGYRLFVGAALCSLGAALGTMAGTVGVEANVLGAGFEGGGAGSWCGAMAGVVSFVRLVGLIAFVRGLLILKAHGEGKDGARVEAALTHMVGGSLAMNIGWTATMLSNSFGLEQALVVMCIG